MVTQEAHRAPALPQALLALTLIAVLFGCESESPSPAGEPTRETLPNGAVLVRYPDLPATDSDTLLWINDTGHWAIKGVDPDGQVVRRFSKPVMSVTETWAGVFDDRGRYWREISHSESEPDFPPPVGLTEC